MRFSKRALPQIVCLLVLALGTLRADPGDVDSSHDYPAFPRLPGFIISDYDEDNPAEFDFPIAQPLPTDSNHIEMVSVHGHRYVIRYELNPGNHALPLYQAQQYYEKLAIAGGFTIEKSGAVGDVTETFYRGNDKRMIWVYLEPAVTVNVLTVVESTENPVSAPPRLVAERPAPRAAIPAIPAIPPTIETVPLPNQPPVVAEAQKPVEKQVEKPAEPPAEKPPAPPVDPDGDDLYAQLSENGRIIVPFVFQPGKDELDDSSQPTVDRIVAMMRHHPDLFLRIEGHTDNHGDADDNLRLSAQRALAVQGAIMSAHIDGKRLDAVGVGGLQPLADNNTAEGREKNRRIELVMWKKYPAFHAPAPNGTNYYPNPGQS